MDITQNHYRAHRCSNFAQKCDIILNETTTQCAVTTNVLVFTLLCDFTSRVAATLQRTLTDDALSKLESPVVPLVVSLCNIKH